MTLVTQVELARRRGVGKSAVSNWKKAGLLVFAEDDQGRAMVHLERTEARLNARVDPTRGRPTTGMNAGDAPELPISAGGDDDDGGEKRALAIVRAEVAQEDLIGKRLKNAEAARELVPAIEAERRCSELGRMARERVQAELRGRAEQMLAASDVRGIMVLQADAVDAAFTAVAEAVEGGALDRIDDDDDADMVDAEAA